MGRTLLSVQNSQQFQTFAGRQPTPGSVLTPGGYSTRTYVCPEKRLATDPAPHAERFEAFGIDMPTPLAGRVPGIANLLQRSETPVQYLRAPPTLGEHTMPIVRALVGRTDAEIEGLKD